MPKELKKRGRRGEKKRKREEQNSLNEAKPKRQRSSDESFDVDVKLDDSQLYPEDANFQDSALHGRPETQFYGLLDEEEQSYFKRADQMLELDQFAEPEERSLFLESLWREVSGKELKVASSQSCSRLLERLIAISSGSNLKTLMQRFSGHFLDLMQHRFASHCCEALVLRSAPLVTEELLADLVKDVPTDEISEPLPSMEDLFLSAVLELEQDVGFLMTDQFGSHSLRMLLLVLSGRPLGDAAAVSKLQGKNKEQIAGVISNGKDADIRSRHRAVPTSFHESLDRVKSQLVGSLDTNALRALANERLASPVIQLLLEIELSERSKQGTRQENSLYQKLLPDQPPTKDSPSGSFLQGLLYDPVGSHLLETLIQCASGKVFKAVYREMLEPNLRSITKHEVATFVLVRALGRLGADDLRTAIEQMTPEVPRLINQSQTSLIRCLVERCEARGIDCQPIVDQMKQSYGQVGPDYLPRMLHYTEKERNSNNTKAQIAAQESVKTHASLLAQAMLKSRGTLMDMITESILATEPSTLLGLAKDRSATHLIQASLNPDNLPQSFRRQLIPKFLGLVPEMTMDSVASHVVDALWTATSDLHFLREKVADEMLVRENEIKSSFFGKAVWRNWMMDLYKRQKGAWVAKAKATEDAENGKPAHESAPNGRDHRAKSGLELARERFAKAQLKGSRVSFKPNRKIRGTALASG